MFEQPKKKTEVKAKVKKRDTEREIAKSKISRHDVQAFRLDDMSFSQWANIKRIPNHKATAWEKKAAVTTSYEDTVFLAGRFFMLTKRQIVDEVSGTSDQPKKYVDPEKYMPRQSRIELLQQETRNSGSTKAPWGNDANWKHSMKGKYLYNLEDSRHEVVYSANDPNTHKPVEITEMLMVHRNVLYERQTKDSQKGLANYIKTVNTKKPELFGTHSLAPVTPLEDIYLLTVDAHIDLNGKHYGRDQTYAKLSKGTSSTIVKDFVDDFLKFCPVCERKRVKNIGNTEQAATKRERARQSRLKQQPQIKQVGQSTKRQTKKRKAKTADLLPREPPVIFEPRHPAPQTPPRSIVSAQNMISPQDLIIQVQQNSQLESLGQDRMGIQEGHQWNDMNDGVAMHDEEIHEQPQSQYFCENQIIHHPLDEGFVRNDAYAPVSLNQAIQQSQYRCLQQGQMRNSGDHQMMVHLDASASFPCNQMHRQHKNQNGQDQMRSYPFEPHLVQNDAHTWTQPQHSFHQSQRQHLEQNQIIFDGNRLHGYGNSGQNQSKIQRHEHPENQLLSQHQGMIAYPRNQIIRQHQLAMRPTSQPYPMPPFNNHGAQCNTAAFAYPMNGHQRQQWQQQHGIYFNP